MSDLARNFASLMQRVRAGDPQAAQEVYEVYSPHIRRVVRRKLHKRLRTQYDSIDFLQQVWASFFTTELDAFQFDTPESLVAFLSHVAYNKVVEVFRQRMQSKKHNLNNEQHLTDPAAGVCDVPARQPTPSQVVMADECWERMTQGQNDQQRRILELRRAGYTYQAIADMVGVNEKTIQRLVRQLQQRAAGDEPPAA